MDDCRIVTDLLPSYCDDLTSWETNTYIRTHLNTCPGCRKLLEQMQQRQKPQEADLRRAKFKAAMEEHARKHKVRKTVLLLVLLALYIGFFVVMAFSRDIAIASEGLDLVRIMQEPTVGYDAKEFQIVACRTREGDNALVWLEKKSGLGFWRITALETATADQPYGAAQITWTETLDSIYGGEPNITPVLHTFYTGRNATGSFERIPYDQLPGNVTVMAEQHASDYYIHVTTVLPNGGSAFDILPLLKESKLIS